MILINVIHMRSDHVQVLIANRSLARGRSGALEDVILVGDYAVTVGHMIQALTIDRSFARFRGGSPEDDIDIGPIVCGLIINVLRISFIISRCGSHMIQDLTMDRGFARFRGGSTEDVIVLGGASTRMTGILDRSFMPIVNSVVTIISMGCDH